MPGLTREIPSMRMICMAGTVGRSCRWKALLGRMRSIGVGRVAVLRCCCATRRSVISPAQRAEIGGRLRGKGPEFRILEPGTSPRSPPCHVWALAWPGMASDTEASIHGLSVDQGPTCGRASRTQQRRLPSPAGAPRSACLVVESCNALTVSTITAGYGRTLVNFERVLGLDPDIL